MSDGNRYGAGRRSKAFQLGVERVDGGLVGVVELAGEPGIDSRLQEEKEPLPLLHALFPAHALQVTGSKLTAGSLLLLPFLVTVLIVQCSPPRAFQRRTEKEPSQRWCLVKIVKRNSTNSAVSCLSLCLG